MRKIALFLFGILALTAAAESVTSPDGKIVFDLTAGADGTPRYSVSYDGRNVISNGRLGLEARELTLGQNAVITADEVTASDSTWEPVWGEYAEIRDNHNERLYHIADSTDPELRFDLRVRVFDDGLGFRYEVHPSNKIGYLTLLDENTTFPLADDMTLFCIPGDTDTDEFLYTTTPFSKLEENMTKMRHSESHRLPFTAIQTPVMMKSSDGALYVNLHEAALVNYPAMQLAADPKALTFKSYPVPDKNGIAAYLKADFVTPWRTLVISPKAEDILASSLILNLNEPCTFETTDWIRPQKFVGVWWEMFTGNRKTWAYSNDWFARPGTTDYSKLESNGRHPANTENVKKYIDFAAEFGIPGVLVEGWNEGWEDWASYRKNRQFLFDKPYPDFDVEGLHEYAASKGVKLIMHHETAGNAADYERQLDRAFQFMVDNGYDAVKTGYVGDIIPRSENHNTQWMVDHFRHVAERAADYKIMIDSHEAVRPTGLCRTYPNWLAQESARGGEFESMSGNTPEHTVILPFTRLMGGPMDYTPGLFEGDLSYYGEGKTNKASTTLTKQLALYLTMPSPLQMACDLPDNYRRFRDAFQFIVDVPVDWADSRYLAAEPGDYIAVARKDKKSDDWYLGAITDENARTMTLDLNFLEPGLKYVATIYEDGPDASWNENPKSYRIREQKVTSKTKLKQRLAPGGGLAIRLQPE